MFKKYLWKRYSITPDKYQRELIGLNIDAYHYVFNEMLVRFTKARKRRDECISGKEMIHILTKMKEYEWWLKQADSQALCCACHQLDKALYKYFNKEGNYPVELSKEERSYTTNSHSVQIMDNGIFLPKLKWVDAVDIELPDSYKICEVKVSHDRNGHYYADVCYSKNSVKAEESGNMKSRCWINSGIIWLLVMVLAICVILLLSR